MDETIKKPNTVLTILAFIFFIGGLVTFIPYNNIDDECMLGYKAICAFTPVSSLVLILLGLVFWFFRKKS